MTHVPAGAGGSEHIESAHLNLGGTSKPAGSVVALDVNWPCNSLIDKCYEQDRVGAKGCSAIPAAVST